MKMSVCKHRIVNEGSEFEEDDVFRVDGEGNMGLSRGVWKVMYREDRDDGKTELAFREL